MKKFKTNELLSILLAFMLLLGTVPATVLAESDDKPRYGEAPIYTGCVEVDYMAEEILKELDLTNKTDRERIRAAYDWVILNCRRTGECNKSYFDMDEIYKKAEGEFYDGVKQKVRNGEILIRANINGADYCDANESVVCCAMDMMMCRVGSCLHYSSLLAVLLGHLGFDCRVIAGEFINRDGTRSEHKWNMVLIDGQYEWLDVRIDHVSYTSTGTLKHDYFLVENTAKWETGHAWDHGYSDWLMNSAANLIEWYGFTSRGSKTVGDPQQNETPWSTCSPWARLYLERAWDAGIYPKCFMLADMTEDVSRSEFASAAVLFYEKLTGRTAKAYSPVLPLPFTDITAEDKDILKAYQLGIVRGVGNGTFQPQGTLTREQAVTMLGRVCELAKNGVIEDGKTLERDAVVPAPFIDADRIGAWAKPYVEHFASFGIVNGTDRGTFEPKQNMTREQALKVAVEALRA